MSLKHISSAILLSVITALQAAYIGYLYPAGGQAGKTVEILIGGQGIWNPKYAIVTGNGVQTVSCESVRSIPHPSGSQRGYLNKWVRQIVKGDRSFLRMPVGEGTIDWRYHPWYSRLNETTPLQFELVTNFLYVPRNSLQMSPSISQNIILKLKIDKNASPGYRELRLTNGSWVSNPVPFYVSNVQEFNEPRYQPPFVKVEQGSFSYPCILNGQIMPGETDKFFFDAKKGDVLYFDLKGRALLPFVGDGVPGHFQAILEIQDLNGKQLAFADDRYFHPDPVLKFKVPADGKYQLVVRDSLYRGRNDFVYRIEIDKNSRPYQISAPPQFAVAPIELPENSKTLLTAPSVIRASISKPGEKDSYCFKAKAGEKMVIDVWARRLNSPVDGLLEIYDPDNKRVFVCDDVKRQRIGNIMQHTDPTIIFTAVKTGIYKAVVSDNAGAGNDDYKYYLRIDNPRPDFRIYGYPSMLEPSYGRGTFSVIVERFDGFNDPVTLKMISPDGYRLCGETTVPAGVCQAAFTLDSFSVRKPNLTTLKMEGSANGITRKVIPATEAMQAFAYNHLIPCEGDFYVSKNGKYWASAYVSWQEKNPSPIKLYPGVSTQITVQIPPQVKLQPDFEITGMSLQDQPLGVLIENVKYKDRIATATIKVTAEAKPVSVNQVFFVNIRYSYKQRNRKTGEISMRKTNAVGVLPSRRLIVEVPDKK